MTGVIFLWLLSGFSLFIFSFQQFDYAVFWILFYLGFAEFFESVRYFPPNLEMFQSLFLQIFLPHIHYSISFLFSSLLPTSFCSLFPYLLISTPTVHILEYFLLSHMWLRLCLLFSIFFSEFFRLNNLFDLF